MKNKKILALTLGLSLAVGTLTGSYTMAQANESPAVNQNMQMGHEKPMNDKGNHQGNHQEMLKLLQIDEQTFKQEADSGKSLAEIAAAHNVSKQAVVDLVVKNMNQQIDKRVADKGITVEQANEMKTNAVEKAQQMVDVKPIGFDKMTGPKHNGHTKPINDKQHAQGMSKQQNFQEMLTLLKIDEQTFAQEQNSGKSLAEIGIAHNVPRQEIVDLVTKNMNEEIDKGLAEERITIEQANEMKANAVEKIQMMVDKNMVEQPVQPQK